MLRTTVSISDLGLEVPLRLASITPGNMRITATTDALDLFRVAAILVVLASAVTAVRRNRWPVARCLQRRWRGVSTEAASIRDENEEAPVDPEWFLAELCRGRAA